MQSFSRILRILKVENIVKLFDKKLESDVKKKLMQIGVFLT